MADYSTPSRAELGVHLGAARDAIERLEANVKSASDEVLEEDVGELSGALEELAALADELDQAKSRRRDAALEAARQRRHYRELFELAPDGYLATDRNGVIRQANRAAGEMLGVPADWLRGKPLVLFFVDGDRTGFHRRLRELPSGGRVADWEATIVARHGRRFPAAIRCSASLNDPDAELRFLVHDLSTVRDAEARERTAWREHADRVRSLEKAKSNFLRLASHELRGPLALIRGYVSMLLDGSFGRLPEDAEKVLPVLDAKVNEMGRMVDDMLDAARLEDGRLEVHPQRLDLAAIARDAVDRMRPLAGPRHGFVMSLSEPVYVEADKQRVATILTNLIDNAIKYSPSGGPVELLVRAQDGDAVAEVKDSGLGIPDDQLDVVFKPFGRIVTDETSHIAGTGLGLYLSRELARIQGGDLALSSTPGEGTTVRLRLPLADGGGLSETG
jgi:PAS domain S-box-containing protein